MEYDRKNLLTDQDNKFVNTRAKIRNKRISNDAAWVEAQHLLTYCVEDYPKNYLPRLSLVRDVFNLRRDSYLDRMTDKEASKGVQELVGKLSEDQQELVTGLVVCIRDLFRTGDILKGKARFKTKSRY